MNADERDLEENTGRLIRAGLPHAARLDPLTRLQLWRRLVTELHTRHLPTAFPNLAVGLLTGILTLMAAWLIGQTFGSGGSIPVNTSPTLIAMAFVTLNLASVPLAAIVIVKGRRHA